MLTRSCCVISCLLGILYAFEDTSSRESKTQGPLSPRDEQTTFRIAPGFRIELVASEPDVIDPVAMAFDEEGRLFVAEMHGYPNEGVATGQVSSGKIKLLEDPDRDGVFEKVSVFADGLRLPTSVMPWKGGLLVANAPDLLYLEDTDADGKADRRRVLYTGFGLSNIQQLINRLQWGLDNWVHASCGSNGGTIRSGESPDSPPVELRGRGIRFHPGVPGSLEPTSGGGQYGLTPDAWQRWFTATNSQHLKQIVLPDHYLRRNPLLPVGSVTPNISDHGPACKVHRISPFEAWRVERTRRRAADEGSKRFPANELVPGGYITSACSPVCYQAAGFPEAYHHNIFVCDPANNLIHRDVLQLDGIVYTAKRGDPDREFLASTDNWFRPVYLDIGPDGCLYVLDFYREAIETPLSLPDDIKKSLNLQSRQRGRIWRIRAEGTKARNQTMPGESSVEQLVSYLDDPNIWWRLTAQRLLVERREAKAIAPLKKLMTSARTPQGRAHALWTLDGLNALPEEYILKALGDEEAGVREQALRLSDARLKSSDVLQKAVSRLVTDPSPRLRFQLALTLGEASTPLTASALAKLVAQDAGDPWMQTAILSSVGQSAASLLEAITRDKTALSAMPATQQQLVQRLAGLVGTRARDKELHDLLSLLAVRGERAEPWQLSLMEGLGEGLLNSRYGAKLEQFWTAPPSGLKDVVGEARSLFEKTAEMATDAKTREADRLACLRVLAYGPFDHLRTAASGALAPQSSLAMQQAAVRALARQVHADVAGLLLSSWSSYGPTLRREVIEGLFARTDRLTSLLDAMERKDVLPVQLEPARLEQLRKHPSAAIRSRAQKLLAGLTPADRARVVEAYRKALDLPADAARGKEVFKKVCITCHRLENEGNEVGPDLVAVLGNKSREQLLHDVLDPSREVDPRYLNYVILTKRGQTLTGLVAAETASSVTLRRGDKAEDVILRTQIDEIHATTKSLMPDGLEEQVKPQDLADLIAYLQTAGRK